MLPCGLRGDAGEGGAPLTVLWSTDEPVGHENDMSSPEGMVGRYEWAVDAIWKGESWREGRGLKAEGAGSQLSL